jgi:RNA polymerase sigma-70 factor (sigma-E family)
MTWEQEYTEYFTARAAQLRRFSYALCGDWHLAEDLVQTTFLQLYRHWRRVDKSSLDPYSRKVLVNAFLSSRRARRPEQIMAQPPDVAGGDAAAALDTALGVRAALAALPPRQRALVVLRHLEDVSVAEAAELLGITEGTVKSQTSHGLAKLRVALGTPAFLGE